MKKVLILGGSISAGFYSEKGGWWKNLENNFIQKYVFANHSKSGSKTTDVIEKIKELSPNYFDVVFIGVGGNDARYYPTEKRFETSLQLFEKNLLTIASLIKQMSVKVVFLGLTDLAKKVVSKPNKNYIKRSDDLYIYDCCIQSVADKTNSEYIKLFDISLTYFKDDVHPDTQGHEKISDMLLSKNTL